VRSLRNGFCHGTEPHRTEKEERHGRKAMALTKETCTEFLFRRRWMCEVHVCAGKMWAVLLQWRRRKGEDDATLPLLDDGELCNPLYCRASAPAAAD
jgi:hypothetical protein